MSRYNHIIHQQIAEIGFSDKTGVQELYREISNLFNHRLSDITNRVFDRGVSEENFIRIERLEIDLGVLSYPFSEQEFAERYENALEKCLSDEITIHTNATEDSFKSNGRIYSFSYAKLLYRFLTEGTLNKWPGEEEKIDPETIFFKLLKENPSELKNVLVSAGVYAHAVKRLVGQFSDQVIQETIRLAEPGEADFIITYHADIVSLQQKEQFIFTETNSFKKALWSFILNYLLAETAGHFQRKMFVKSTLSQMAAHFNIAYEQLLRIFSDTAVVYPDFMRLNNSLAVIILELKEEVNAETGFDELNTQGVFPDKEEGHDDFEILIYYLFYGSLPFQYQYILPAQLETIWQKTLKQNPVWVKRIFESKNISEFVLKRLTQHLPNTILAELIHLIEPAQSDFIINYHTTTISLQKKKNIVKTEESEFSKSLWEFIFAFLLYDKGTLFNEKAFVESNIRRLARHYNIDFKDLLLFLTQGLGEEFSVIGKYSSLFYIFTEILHQHIKEEHPENILFQKKIQEINSDNDKTHTNDLFLFWLTEGHLPWWSDYKTLSHLPKLFARFIKENPKEALRIIQSAMQKGIHPDCMFNDLFPELQSLLESLPSGKVALASIQEPAFLLLFRQKWISPEEIKHFLLVSAFESYYQKQFLAFDKPLFIFIFLDRLHKFSGLSKNVLTEKIVDLLKNKKTEFTENDLSAFIKMSGEKKLSEIYPEGRKDFFPPAKEQILVFEEQPFQTLSSEQLLSSAIALVRYFLLHGTFPEDVSATSDVQKHSLLRRLILLIYREDKAQLQNIFNDTGFSNSARMQLHDAFLNPGNQETRNISAMLQTHIERDTLQYIFEQWPQIQQSDKPEEIFTRIKEQVNVDIAKSIFRKLFKNTSVTSLLASTYKGSAFINLFAYISNDKHVTLINNYLYLLGLAVTDSFERALLLQHFREFCFIWLSSFDFSDFSFTEFLFFLSRRKNWNVSALYLQLNKLPDKLSFLKTDHLQQLVSDMQDKSASFAEAVVFQKKITRDREKIEKKLLQSVFDQGEESEEKKEINMKEKKIEEGENMHLHNAGLVLLYPFFSTFFGRTGLTDSTGKFVSEEAKLRSPLLLQYLITSQTKESENNLVLNKILCGLTHTDVVPLTIELSELEKNTSNDLLQAVIQQWEKLKNTSVQGLRESFLQREGTLRENDEAWALKVEARGYDILLQTLPWGLNMIKTPWMNKPLFVTWI